MRADQFEQLSDESLQRWANFGRWPDRTYFPAVLGLEVEEIRLGYCRMRLPYNPDFEQPAGVVHGGALASLVDTVVVPAIGSAYAPGEVDYATVTMNVNYLRGVRQTDVTAEGWVTKRGRSMVFCQVVAWTTDYDKPVLEGSLVYTILPGRG